MLGLSKNLKSEVNREPKSHIILVYKVKYKSFGHTRKILVLLFTFIMKTFTSIFRAFLFVFFTKRGHSAGILEHFIIKD
jgi:hypothetical protein